MQKSGLKLARKKLLIAWVFVLPVLLIRAVTTLYPVGMTVGYSFMDFDLIKQTKQFNGVTNYIALLNDTGFKQAFSFTLKFTLISMLSIVVLGIILALLMKYQLMGRKLLRTVSLIPWGMAMIVVSIAGTWIFDDTYGIVNDLIRRTIDPNFHYGWLASNTGAQIAVIIVNVWKNTPFFAIIMLSAFQGIPSELYESARIDGANSITIFFKIMLPYVLSTFIMMIIFIGVGQISSFEIVYGMTRGGPGSTTSLLAYKLYMEATKSLNYGAASAITTVMFLIMAVFGGIGLYLHRKVDY